MHVHCTTFTVHAAKQYRVFHNTDREHKLIFHLTIQTGLSVAQSSRWQPGQPVCGQKPQEELGTQGGGGHSAWQQQWPAGDSWTAAGFVFQGLGSD